MDHTDEYLEVNRANWDERAAAHAASPDYRVRRFLEDPTYRSDVVRFDEPRLGDVTGVTGVHLQCHIGTDTVSLARLGARMSGLDLSPASIAEARRLSEATGADLDLVVSDVYGAVEALGGRTFDLVYTGIGALGWLPDIERWAGVVSTLLAPGGRLFLREGHPVLFATEQDRTDVIALEYPYFQTVEPQVWDEPGTYVATDVEFVHTRTMEWNHGLGEVVTALLRHGLVLTMLEEHTSVPWDALPGQLDLHDDGEWRLRERPERIPLTYTLQARKPS